MLSLTPAQLEAFRIARRTTFAQELADRALRRHPAQAARFTREQLLEEITQELSVARSYGLRTRGEFKRFLDLSMTFGFGFAKRESWARDRFGQRKIPAEARLKDVEQVAVFAYRERAAHG